VFSICFTLHIPKRVKQAERWFFEHFLKPREFHVLKPEWL